MELHVHADGFARRIQSTQYYGGHVRTGPISCDVGDLSALIGAGLAGVRPEPDHWYPWHLSTTRIGAIITMMFIKDHCCHHQHFGRYPFFSSSWPTARISKSSLCRTHSRDRIRSSWELGTLAFQYRPVLTAAATNVYMAVRGAFWPATPF